MDEKPRLKVEPPAALAPPPSLSDEPDTPQSGNLHQYIKPASVSQARYERPSANKDLDVVLKQIPGNVALAYKGEYHREPSNDNVELSRNDVGEYHREPSIFPIVQIALQCVVVIAVFTLMNSVISSLSNEIAPGNTTINQNLIDTMTTLTSLLPILALAMVGGIAIMFITRMFY